jgi:hypothetical protein
MSGKRLMTGFFVLTALAPAGCCRWCERHCMPQAAYAQPAYAQPAVCCPQPVCCQPAPAYGPPTVQHYEPPPQQQQWQRTYSSPPTCSCQ